MLCQAAACLACRLHKVCRTRAQSLHAAAFVLLYERSCESSGLLEAQADVCTMAGTASLTAAALVAGGREAAGAGNALPRLGAPAGC